MQKRRKGKGSRERREERGERDEQEEKKTKEREGDGKGREEGKSQKADVLVHTCHPNPWEGC